MAKRSVFGFTEAYHRFVSTLSDAEKSAAFAEGEPAARLYGAVNAPRSWESWEQLLRTMEPQLEGSAILAEFLDIMASGAILPGPLRWLQRLLVRAAVDMTPEPVRSFPQLRAFGGLRPGEAAVVKLLGKPALQVPLPSLPPSRAERRLQVQGWAKAKASADGRVRASPRGSGPDSG